MKKRKRLLWILIITGAAALAAALVFVSWTKGAFLPSWIQWKEKSLDVSGMAGGSGPDAITLDRRQVNVIYNSESVWQSPDNVLVQDFLWCDIDHDEENELILTRYLRVRLRPAVLGGPGRVCLEPAYLYL